MLLPMAEFERFNTLATAVGTPADVSISIHTILLPSWRQGACRDVCRPSVLKYACYVTSTVYTASLNKQQPAWINSCVLSSLGCRNVTGERVSNVMRLLLHNLAPGPPSPLSNGDEGLLARGVKLTTYVHLAPRLRTREAIPPLPQYVFMALYLVKHRGNLTAEFTSGYHVKLLNIPVDRNQAEFRLSRFSSVPHVKN